MVRLLDEMIGFLVEIYHPSFLPSLLSQSYALSNSVPRAPRQSKHDRGVDFPTIPAVVSRLYLSSRFDQ